MKFHVESDLLASWVKTLGAILGSGGGLTLLIKYLVDRKRSKKVDRHVEGLRDLVGVYEILNDIVASTAASRALIVRSSNGGGVPRPDKPVVVSVMNEVYVPPFTEPSRKWQDRPADEQYSKLLLDLVKSGKVDLATERLPKNSDLRTLYDADGVVRSEIYVLHLGGREMVYLSLNFPGLEKNNDKAEALLRQKINDLKIIYERYRGTSFDHSAEI